MATMSRRSRARPAEDPAPANAEPAAGPAPRDDLEARLRLLKRLFEQELITEEEYAAKKAELLKNL
jgi:hypothetical protein